MTIIERDSSVPFYLQIKEDIIEKIKSGDYETDERIPGENALKNIYNVSLITVRKALTELVNEGYLYRIQGKGTYVAKRKINRMLNLMSFTEEMRKKGLNCVSKVLTVTKIQDFEIAKKLKIKRDEQIIKINRLRIIDDLPIALQCSYIPRFILSLEEAKRVYEVHSLYKVLKENDIYPGRAYEKYNAAVLQDAENCKLLKMKRGEPVFKVKRFTYTDEDLLFEYAVSILKGDVYTMEVELEE